jgi:hypothetical protein
MERLGLAVFRAYDLGLYGSCAVHRAALCGGGERLGLVARWALTGRRHREIKTLSLALRVSWVFHTCQSPHLHFLEKKSGEGADGDLKATGIGAIALLAYI